MAAYTSQAVGNVMSTGGAGGGNYVSNPTGQPTVQIGQERYVIANAAPMPAQYDRIYVPQ